MLAQQGDRPCTQAVRRVIERHGYHPPPAPAPLPLVAYAEVHMAHMGSLLDLLPTLSSPVHSEHPRIMEDYGQG